MFKSPNSITVDLFDLTPEQKAKSIAMYGKIVKCLVAPYHTINTLPLEPNNIVYVYPERDLTIKQRKELMSVIAKAKQSEILLVTSDVFIITDMIDDCVRILTSDNKIIDCREQTFSANAHTILLKILQNDSDDKIESQYVKIIQKVINDINSKSMSQKTYDETKKVIESIGEPIIAVKLKEMLRDVKII